MQNPNNRESHIIPCSQPIDRSTRFVRFFRPDENGVLKFVREKDVSGLEPAPTKHGRTKQVLYCIDCGLKTQPGCGTRCQPCVIDREENIKRSRLLRRQGEMDEAAKVERQREVEKGKVQSKINNDWKLREAI